MKWEPAAAMVLMLALGLWLVWGSSHWFYGVTPRPDTRTVELRIGNSRGVIEVNHPDTPAPVFRVLLRNGFISEEFTAEQFRKVYGDEAYNVAVATSTNPFFRLFNITSWTSLIWISIGLAGQAAFSGRTLIQWFVSEKRRESVVPEIFWWLSLGGGAALFAYFVWRQDVVGVLGQSSGIVVYARNLKLIHKRRRQLAAAPPQPPAS